MVCEWPGRNYGREKYWLIRLCIIFLVEITIFWIGMISVYLTSQQLGIRWRVLGLICGWIPIAHLVMLHIIIRTVRREVKFEKLRAKRNAARADAQICKTKYPILMVHGVFFRDFEHLNYWGRIPAELMENGAKIYYGNHNSAAAVRDSAKELETRIRQIVEETGCEKVNVVAHPRADLIRERQSHLLPQEIILRHLRQSTRHTEAVNLLITY